MNKIYISNNYIIVEKENEDFPRPFPINHSEYNEDKDHFILRKYPNKDIVIISFLNVGDWENELGEAYNESSLREFLQQNTGFNIGGGNTGNEGSVYIEGEVDTFNDLPNVLENLDKRYEVKQGSGGIEVLGKRYFGKDPGIYKSNGVNWIKLSHEDLDSGDINSDQRNLSWTNQTILLNQLEDLSSYNELEFNKVVDLQNKSNENESNISIVQQNVLNNSQEIVNNQQDISNNQQDIVVNQQSIVTNQQDIDLLRELIKEEFLETTIPSNQQLPAGIIYRDVQPFDTPTSDLNTLSGITFNENTGEITCNEDGLYRIYFETTLDQYDGNNRTSARVRLVKNNVLVKGSEKIGYHRQNANGFSSYNFYKTLFLIDGDIVKVQARNNDDVRSHQLLSDSTTLRITKIKN